jgi:hypothetical protein
MSRHNMGQKLTTAKFEDIEVLSRDHSVQAKQ